MKHNREKLLMAAINCSGLAALMSNDTPESSRDIAILRKGAIRFTQGLTDLSHVEDLLEVIGRSFSDNGPRVQTLLRELAALPTTETSSPAETQMIGIFKCDREGKFVASFRDDLPNRIKRMIPIPYEGKRARVSRFNPQQRIITEAFFKQQDGELILPALLDVFGYYLQARYKREWFYESEVVGCHRGFVQQSAEVLYKLRLLGKYSTKEYQTSGSIKIFEKMIIQVMSEYEEITGYPVTPAMLEKIALREEAL